MKKKSKIWIFPLMIIIVFLISTSCGNRIANNKNQKMNVTVTDIDGNVYHTVTIGSQVWMAENLKTTKYRNSDTIPNVIDSTKWLNLTTGACCNYDNNTNYSTTYGKLYNWHAVNDSRNIAPTGWHVPTDTEWATLITYLGGEKVAIAKLKETGTTHWKSPNAEATNETGFTALPGSFRRDVGTFYVIGDCGTWWSSTENNASSSWSLWQNEEEIFRSFATKLAGLSVRCVKD